MANFNEKLQTRIYQNKGVVNVDVALVGSSSAECWGKYLTKQKQSQKIINWGIGGSTVQDWNNSIYINAIAKSNPKKIIVYGVSALTRNPKISSASEKLIKEQETGIKKFCTSLINTCNKVNKKKPIIVLLSGISTPIMYASSKPSTIGRCIVWDRVDKYNKWLSNFCKKTEGINYFNLEKYYYYKMPDNRLRFYIGEIGDKTKVTTCLKILKKDKYCPYFAKDLKHPSDKAFEKIWIKIFN